MSEPTLTQVCKIAYHGTDPDSAKQILESGAFRTGTYFAFRIEDAIKFGGPCVFAVKFSEDPKHWKGESDGWQFHLRNPYSTDNILEKTDGVSYPTQIPASVIPELVEHLMSSRKYQYIDGNDVVSEAVYDVIYLNQDGDRENEAVDYVLTAALEAFNDRDSGCSAKELAEDINSLPGGPLWPGGVEGDQDET